jgi:transcriptional regulator with XRE-family HTH domain
MSNLIEKIERYLASNNKSRDQFAATIGVSASTLNKVLAGITLPSRMFIFKVSAVIGDKTFATLNSFNFELNNYSQSQAQYLVGEYQTFRPSFREPNSINCFKTTISWSDENACLVFYEDGNILSPGNKGYVSIPQTEREIYLLSCNNGIFRLGILLGSYKLGFFYGAQLTVASPKLADRIPTSAVVAFEKIDAGKECFSGLVCPKDENYRSFREALDLAKAEGFYLSAE